MREPQRVDRAPRWRPWIAGLLLAALAGTGPAAGSEVPPAGEAVRRVEKRVVVVGPEGRIQAPLILGRGGTLGVALLGLTPELLRHFGVPGPAGALVSRVEAGGPAARAGVQVGDVLTRVGGRPAVSALAVQGALVARREGERVAVEAWRGGRLLELAIPVAERERPRIDLPSALLLTVEGGGGAAAAERASIESLEVDSQALDHLLGSFQAGLGPDLRERLLQYRRRNDELEERLAELEARLRALEKHLADSR